MSNLQEVKNTAENSLLNKIKEIKNSGVEFRKLGEICKRQKGINITALQMKELNKDNGKIRIFAGGNTIANVNYEDIPNASIINIPSIIVKSRGKVDFEYYDKPFTHKNELWSYSQNSDKINLKFIYYYLCNNLDYFIKKSVRGAMPQIATPDTDDFEIPIPPLEVQAEIVRILDTFTELIKELIKEHELRKKQYSYYRDKLLTFENNIQYKNLSEICSFIYGYTEKAKDEGNVRFVRITDILETGCLNPEGAKYINLTSECEKYLLKKGDLLTARAGATYGKTLYFDEDYPAVYASYLIKLNLDNNLILNRYYWHFAKSSYYWKQANKLAVGGAQPNLNANSLAKIIVPLPPLDTQKRIVDILDNFEKYTNDLQEGLPAEIEKRQKQYAYYRDELLRFERK